MPKPLDPRCPIARSLNVIGERWTLLILRDFVLHGPRRFQDLQESLVGISPNTLSARLKTLEEAGVIQRELYAQHPPRATYRLTRRGEALRPVTKALKDWGEAYVPRR